MKCGDTFIDTMFEPVGSGMYDAAAHDSTFASTYASTLATLQGDGTKATYVATLTSDGVDPTTAGTVGDSYCGSLAKDAAEVAAFAAGDASAATKWITLTSYSTGANPVIKTTGTIHAGIRWGMNGSAWSGGWKLSGVDFDGGYIAAILYDPGPVAAFPAAASDAPPANGLWIENCRITNCYGMPQRSSGVAYPSLVSPYMPLSSSAADLMRVSYVRMKNVTIDHVDSPYFLWGSNHVLVDGLTVANTYINSGFHQGISTKTGSVLIPCDNIVIKNSTLGTGCYAANPVGQGPGYHAGQSALLFANCNSIVLIGLDISGEPLITSDGNAVDFEGQAANPPDFRVLVKDCTIHDNVGSAFLHNDSALNDANALFLMQHNTFTNNAGANAARPMLIGERVGTQTNVKWYWTNNTVTRNPVGQVAWGGQATNPYSPVTSTPPANHTFGSSNTII